jgi:hypothetical protein
MVAPAGVNEGTPQDPVTAGGAGVEVTETPTAESEPTETARAQADPANAGQASAVQADAGQASAVRADTGQTDAGQADTGHAEAKPARVIPAEVVPAPAKPADEELAVVPDGGPAVAAPTEEGLAKATPGEEGQADAAPAEEGLADAAPAETSPGTGVPGEAEPTDGEHAEADAGEPDWDAEEQRRDIGPLAVVGMIFGVIALVGVAAGVLAVITHGFRPKTVITYRPAAVFGLRPGECVKSGANALNVTVVSCATAHDAEVFAVFSLPDTAWPGTSAVQQNAGNGCASRLSGYLNPALATADLTQEYVYPNKTAWQAGERTVVCEIRAASGPLTGSVRAKR